MIYHLKFYSTGKERVNESPLSLSNMMTILHQSLVLSKCSYIFAKVLFIALLASENEITLQPHLLVI